MSPAEANEKFGFLLEAFKFGATTAWRYCVRLGPNLHAARRGPLIARRDRISEDGRWLRSVDVGTRPITAAQRKEAGIDAKPVADSS